MKNNVRWVDATADGKQTDDVLPVHRPKPVLHAPRGRGSLIRHEVQDVDENGTCEEDEALCCGGRQPFEIRVRVEIQPIVVGGSVHLTVVQCTRRSYLFLHNSFAQLLDLVFERPFWYRTVDERPGCPSVGIFLLFLPLVLGGVLEDMGSEIKRPSRA